MTTQIINIYDDSISIGAVEKARDYFALMMDKYEIEPSCISRSPSFWKLNKMKEEIQEKEAKEESQQKEEKMLPNPTWKTQSGCCKINLQIWTYSF